MAVSWVLLGVWWLAREVVEGQLLMLFVSMFLMVAIDQKVQLAEISPPSLRLHYHGIRSIDHLIVDG
jgi:hypothetical protein